MAAFEIRDQFYLNGRPFKIISGSIHYFRVPAPYWRDRLEKLKALGCNTVETYVAWNLHEPKKGQFDFSGMLDLVGFIKMAQELGLYAIVRPSPYICAEWEFGGLPAWLLNEKNVRLRTSEGAFLSHVRDYYKVLLPMLAPLQIENGGPIILMQVENEYGSFGDDHAYLEAIRDMMRELGVTVPLITSDGPWSNYLQNGSIEGALPTGNFGSKADSQLDILAKWCPGRPLMCTEFWVGWFDSWGMAQHSTTDAAISAENLAAILKRGSVNIYMFHGGTNFGFMNGANDYNCLSPDVTSYDYDALLTEDGQITEKYRAFQKIISQYSTVADIQTTPHRLLPQVLQNAGRVTLKASLKEPVQSAHPMAMEALGQSYGYTLYTTTVAAPLDVVKTRLYKTGDRAQIFADDTPILTLYDRELLLEQEKSFTINQDLAILVENMGRVNYGAMLNQQQKGITGDVYLNGFFHTGWNQYPLPLEKEDIAALSFAPCQTGVLPAFHQFKLKVDTPKDTFIHMAGFGKGCVFINGFNLGRFWRAGPQRTLYLPGPMLHEGENQIVVFETEGIYQDTLTLTDEPNLG